VVNAQQLRFRLGQGRRADGHRERGAVLVEAAVIFPVLIFIVLGICEYGLAYRNSLTVSSATRAGARTASALARNGTFDTDTVDAVSAALTALPKGRWQEIWVYDAQTPAAINPGMPDSGNFTTCTKCVRFRWDPAANSGNGDWVADGGTWDPLSQNACAGTADYVGVYVKAEHKYVTKLFGSSRTLEDHTVMRFEPLPSATGCS
jgi:Flp pilus assembly protein TadG